jgi:hypothetical protein
VACSAVSTAGVVRPSACRRSVLPADMARSTFSCPWHICWVLTAVVACTKPKQGAAAVCPRTSYFRVRTTGHPLERQPDPHPIGCDTACDDRAESDASQGCRLAGACGNRGSVASSPLYTPAAVQALLPDERPRGGAVQGDQDRCRVEVVAHGDGVPCAAQQGHRTAQCVHSPLLPCQCIPSKNIKSNSNLI